VSAPSSVQKRIRAPLSRIVGFRRDFSRLLRDGWSVQRRALLQALLLGLAAPGVQAASLGVLAAFLSALESGSGTNLAGLELAGGASLQMLLAASAAIALGLSLAAWLEKAADGVQFQMVVDYELHCAERGARSLLRAWNSPVRVPSDAGSLVFAQRLVNSDSQTCGVGLRFLSKLGPDIAAGLALTGVLLYLDAQSTLLVAALAPLALAYLYFSALRGVRASRRREQSRQAAQRDIGAFLRMAGGGERDPRAFESAIGKYVSGEARADALRAWRRMRLTVSENRMATTVFSAAALLAIIAVQASDVVSGDGSWARLIAYIAFLRLMLSYIVSAAAGLGRLNRAYPAVARYFDFVDRIDRLSTDNPFADLAPDWTAEFATGDGANRVGMTAGPGERLALVQPRPANRRDAAILADRMRIRTKGGRSQRPGPGIVATGQTAGEGVLVHMVRAPADEEPSEDPQRIVVFVYTPDERERVGSLEEAGVLISDGATLLRCCSVEAFRDLPARELDRIAARPPEDDEEWDDE